MDAVTQEFEAAKDVKVENVVGYTKVPLGLAGPLTIIGDYQKGAHYFRTSKFPIPNFIFYDQIRSYLPFPDARLRGRYMHSN